MNFEAAVKATKVMAKRCSLKQLRAIKKIVDEEITKREVIK